MHQPPNRLSDSQESLQREHLRLQQQLEDLEIEHRNLETGPFDRAAHREHLRHLALAKEELRAHMMRLKQRRTAGTS